MLASKKSLKIMEKNCCCHIWNHSSEDLMATEQERAADEECEETFLPSPMELSTKELSKVFSLLVKGLEIVTQSDLSTKHSEILEEEQKVYRDPTRSCMKKRRNRSSNCLC
jgi:hypothetical protein